MRRGRGKLAFLIRGHGSFVTEGTRDGRGAHFQGMRPVSSSSVVSEAGESAQGKQQPQPVLLQEACGVLSPMRDSLITPTAGQERPPDTGAPGP